MSELRRLQALLCALHERLQAEVLAARDAAPEEQRRVAAVTEADTLYQADAGSEAVVRNWFLQHWPAELPVEVVMEGAEDEPYPAGTLACDTRYKCIIDPIDGTRGFVHDKRSAWILSALAPQRGPDTHLGDLCVAVMTELPTVKQRKADRFSAVRGGGVVGLRRNLDSGSEVAIVPQPSPADGFEHGFASLARFFPRGKSLSARFEEALWEGLGVAPDAVFEDQYLATGGQLHELMTGRDRLLGDLRPLVHAALGVDAPVCHPYDVCTALIAQEAGCVVEEVRGGPLDAPLDTRSPVAWIGFANPRLAARVRPVLDVLLARFFPA